MTESVLTGFVLISYVQNCFAHLSDFWVLHTWAMGPEFASVISGATSKTRND